MNRNHWKSIDGWFSFRDCYDELVQELDSGVIVETGAYLGKSICYLGQAIKDSGKPLRAVTVETGTGSGIEMGVDAHSEAVVRGQGTLIGELHRNVLQQGVQDVVTIMVADSISAADLFADHSVAAVFLDSAHTRPHLDNEIRKWLRKVKPGGILSGHDYTSHWTQVVAAVKDNLPGAEPWGFDSWRYRVPKGLT